MLSIESFNILNGLLEKGYFSKRILIEKLWSTYVDWVGSPIDHRSTIGYCSYVWGNLVTWMSKKQTIVARSSIEAEFKALANEICEGMWIKSLLEELRFPIDSPMRIVFRTIKLQLVLLKIVFITTGLSMQRLIIISLKRRLTRGLSLLDTC